LNIDDIEILEVFFCKNDLSKYGEFKLKMEYNIIESFDKISDTLEAMDWLKVYFTDNKARQKVSKMIENPDSILKTKFYSRTNKEIDFFFICYNRSTKYRMTRHIVLFLNDGYTKLSSKEY